MGDTAIHKIILSAQLALARRRAQKACTHANNTPLDRISWNTLAVIWIGIAFLLVLIILLGAGVMWFSHNPPRDVSMPYEFVAGVKIALVGGTCLIVWCVSFLIPLFRRARRKDFTVKSSDLEDFNCWLSGQSQDIQKLAPSDQYITYEDIKKLQKFANISESFQAQQAYQSKKGIQAVLDHKACSTPFKPRRM